MTNRSRWDDEYDAYQDDHARVLTIDPTEDRMWYQDPRYDR